jgi:hypothetical protein
MLADAIPRFVEGAKRAFVWTNGSDIEVGLVDALGGFIGG